MSLFELFIIYAVSWWLILFMVLPWGVRIPAKPGLGHAASAPENAQLKRKLIITSFIALLVPLAAWSINQARAESGIYHAGSNDCAEPADLAFDDSVNAFDSDATIKAAGPDPFEEVPTYLDTPASDYSDNKQLENLGGGVVNVGVVDTNTRTGEVRMNGQLLNAPASKPEHCK